MGESSTNQENDSTGLCDTEQITPFFRPISLLKVHSSSTSLERRKGRGWKGREGEKERAKGVCVVLLEVGSMRVRQAFYYGSTHPLSNRNSEDSSKQACCK